MIYILIFLLISCLYFLFYTSYKIDKLIKQKPLRILKVSNDTYKVQRAFNFFNIMFYYIKWKDVSIELDERKVLFEYQYLLSSIKSIEERKSFKQIEISPDDLK